MAVMSKDEPQKIMVIRLGFPKVHRIGKMLTTLFPSLLLSRCNFKNLYLENVGMVDPNLRSYQMFQHDVFGI